jgi:DivIVA domain-containing protein
MEAGNTQDTPTPRPAPPRGEDPLSGEEVRRATFPQALRGYDRQAVHDMLDRVADWMEGKAGAVSSAAPGVREEIAKVGEKTASILNAAEDAARNLREEAAEYAARLRADVEDEARKTRLNAGQRTDEMIAEADEKSKRIIDEAIARRRQLNLAISSLIDRRDEIAADATRLAEELLAAVEELRSPAVAGEPASDGGETAPEAVPDLPAPEPESAEEEILEPESAEEDVFEPESEEEEVFEPESEEAPTLLVDPDAEDEIPPHGNVR